MGIISIISRKSYITVNKTLMKEYGLMEAVLLGELAGEYEYWAANGGLTDDGYFFSTIENVQEETTLTVKQQRKAIDSLKKRGVLDVRVKGQPSKRYFKINESAIYNLLFGTEQNVQNGNFNFAEMDKLKSPTGRTNKNNKEEIINKNNNKNNDVHLWENEIILYLNEKAKTNYRASSKATKTLIHARLSEGFTVDDFKTVIDKKCAEWIGTDFAQYLRPATLFGTKFEAYLNAPIRERKNYGPNGVEIKKEINAEEEELLKGIL